MVVLVEESVVHVTPFLVLDFQSFLVEGVDLDDVASVVEHLYGTSINLAEMS